jgi:hypothetical protein
MTIAWAAGPKGYEFVVDAMPLGLQVGTQQFEGAPKPIPIMMLEYDLDQIAFLVRIAKYVRERGLEPTVYFWNLESKQPQTALYFDIKDPGIELLEDFCSPTLEILFATGTPRHCYRLRVGIAGAVHPENANRFLASFQEHRVAIAAFVEADKIDSQGRVFPLASVPSHTLLKIPFSMHLIE